jgi:L-alanine-DL-glutamate epimerase-like enolase superfamily enzyme
MKVTGLRTMVVEAEKPYPIVRYWLLLELMTDEGITGIGERTVLHYSDNLKGIQAHVRLIEEIADQFVIGENPLNIERIWDQMYGNRHDLRHPSLWATPAISAIDMALWDIAGKAADLPIYSMLGGQYHEKIPVYAYMPREIDLRKQPMRDIPLWEIELAAKIFENIRKAVGNKLEVGIGTHGQLTTYSAIRIADFLEPYRPIWFEEPVYPENIDEMARVAAHTNIPIATGERLVTKWEFSQVLEKQAAQIIQLDVGQCGGITEAKKIAGIAEAHYAMIAPHHGVGAVHAAAGVQISTCSPNVLVNEWNVDKESLHNRIFKEPIVAKDGFVVPPTGPGLGVEFDEDVLKAHLVE